MRRIGIAGGAAYFFETVAFATMAQAAGLLGAEALAAYTILHNVETTVFMIALGLSVASAVRIGQAAGAGDRDRGALGRRRRPRRRDGPASALLGARRFSPSRPRWSASTAPTRR